MNGRFFIILWVTNFLIFGKENLFAHDHDHANEASTIRQNIKNYTEMFSRRDPQELAKFWTEDAIFFDPTSGQFVRGRQAIVEEYKRWFTRHHTSKIDFTIGKITFPEANRALVMGFLQVEFNEGQPPLKHAFRALLIQQDGRWLFEEVRQIPLKTQQSNNDKLKPLEWLIGYWVDSDKDVTISFDTRWDKHQNMLIQTFTMGLYEQEVLEGRQIILWDPIEKKIRSWVFDSDGGFGQGIWYEKNGSWFVKISYILPDGKKASAVNIYRKINDQSYSWSSVARDVNGEILPNIEPVIVEREEGDKQ